MNQASQVIAELGADIAILDGWGAVGAPNTRDELNRTETTVETVLSRQVLTGAIQLSEHGHRLLIDLGVDDWSLRLEIIDGTVSVGHQAGEWFQPFPLGSDASDAEAEFLESRFDALANRCAEAVLQCTITATIRNLPTESGFHWIRSRENFLETVSTRGRWLNFCRQIYGAPEIRRLIVQDAGSDVLKTRGLVLHGPEVFPESPTKHPEGLVDIYRQQFLPDARVPTPERIASLPADALVSDLTALSKWLDRVALALVWLWLAAKVDLGDPAEPILTFEGWREVVVHINDLPPEEGLDEALALWRWSTASVDSVRREAVQQAISLSVSSASDLVDAANPTLRTARYLNRLASQGPVAEALASRRAAREAALASARSSASSVQQFTRSLVDRVLALLGGAFGVAIANQQALLDKKTAGLLLVGVATLALIVFMNAIGFEHSTATRQLQSLRKDIRAYRDTLVEDDIAAIENLATIRDADMTLRGATWILAILAFLTSGVLLLLYAKVAAPIW